MPFSAQSRFEGSRVLHFAQDERTLHFRDALDFREFFKDEAVIGFQVFHDDFQKEVVDSADGITFHDFVDVGDGFMELPDVFIVVGGEGDVAEDDG